MRRRLIYRIAAVVGVVATGAAVWSFLQTDQTNRPLSGYVEGESVYLAAPASGALEALYVREGDRVQTGAVTFQIDPGVQEAQERGATASVEAARARADDLRTGQRAQELEVFDTELAAARRSSGKPKPAMPGSNPWCAGASTRRPGSTRSERTGTRRGRRSRPSAVAGRWPRSVRGKTRCAPPNNRSARPRAA
ncbi:MAG: biotin/lipoyl-binding protein [Alphaproteobacteria bacterium]|nr:biotin/lipoyl-binding protein [Alphaproteobacteria bacterium]